MARDYILQEVRDTVPNSIELGRTIPVHGWGHREQGPQEATAQSMARMKARKSPRAPFSRGSGWRGSWNGRRPASRTKMT